MRLINQTPVELFVREYIRQNNINRTVQGLDFYRKALAYVLQKLDTTCCDPDEPITNLYTNKDNLLTNTVFRLLLQMSRSGNVKSLIRTRDLLEDVINNVCCDDGTITPDLVVACDTPVLYNGNASFPRIVEVTLGTGTGTVNFDFNAYNIPDKFIVKFDDVDVIDTGYRGASSQQGNLTAALASRGLGNEVIAGVGTGSDSFVKGTVTTKAYIYIYAPLSNTQWTFTMDCPEA